jgi:group I intron endonuclease
MSEEEKLCGIYALRHKQKAKVYIGKSIDIRKRINSHVYALERKEHTNKDLQKDWDECGIEGFELKILEKCSMFDLQEKEQFYIDKFDSINKGYNQVRAVYDPSDKIVKNFSLTADTFDMLLEMCETDNMSRNDMINEIIEFCYNSIFFERRNNKPVGYEWFLVQSKRKRA